MKARPCIDCGRPCFGNRCRPCDRATRVINQPCVECPDCGTKRTISRSMLSKIRLGAATGCCHPCSQVRIRERTATSAEEQMQRGTKTCCMCKGARPLSEFNRATKHRDGLASRCRACDRETARAYYQAHKERWVGLDWPKRNPERRREIARNHARRWRRAHPERARARKDRTDFDAILAEHGMVCHICTKAIPEGDLHFDHVIPLSRGGEHSRDNILPSHSRCNLRKGTKLMEEMAA